jgi:hypothetical protein
VQAWNSALWGNAAQWAGALMTFAAVIVALFKEDFIRCRRHPKLTVLIEAKPPYCIRLPAAEKNREKPWKGWRYWLRVWVKNEGNVRAEKVEVFLSHAFVRNNGSFEPVPNFTPMNLQWSYTHETYIEGISPEMGRFCDFGAISDPGHPDLSEDRTRLSLSLQSHPGIPDWLHPGHYKFEIMLAGSNCEPVAHWIHLHLTGVWENEPAKMLSNGFTVTLSSKM